MLLVYSYELSVVISFNFNLLACCPTQRWPLWVVDGKKMGGGGIKRMKDKNQSWEKLNQCKGSLPLEFQSPISFFVPLISMRYLQSSLQVSVVR